MTQAGIGVDDDFGSASKTATTVAMDFGRIKITDQLVLYLFGHPPARSASGSCGTGCSRGRSARSCWSTPAASKSASTSWGDWRSAVCRSSSRSTPSRTPPATPVADLRSALDLSERIPIMDCDVRRRASSRDVLMTLMRFLHSLAMTGSLTWTPGTLPPPVFPFGATTVTPEPTSLTGDSPTERTPPGPARPRLSAHGPGPAD
ncbi:hypothetical protein GCM10023238_10480 [Streptomyces heliomycini]